MCIKEIVNVHCSFHTSRPKITNYRSKDFSESKDCVSDTEDEDIGNIIPPFELNAEAGAECRV